MYIHTYTYLNKKQSFTCAN